MRDAFEDDEGGPSVAAGYVAPSFVDRNVAAALAPLVDRESVTWPEFLTAVGRLAEQRPAFLLALQREIVEAIVNGRYVAVDPGPFDVFSVTYALDDADVPFGGLSYALIDLDNLRDSHGTDMVRTSIEDRLARPSMFPADALMLCLRVVPSALRARGEPDPLGVAPWDVEEELNNAGTRRSFLSLAMLTSSSHEFRYVVQRFEAADARGVDAFRVGDAHQWGAWKLRCEWIGEAEAWRPDAPAVIELPSPVVIDHDFVLWVARSARAASANRAFAERVRELGTPSNRNAATSEWGWLSPDAWLYLRAAAALETSAPPNWLLLSPEEGEAALIRFDFEGTEFARDIATDESRHFGRGEGARVELSREPSSTLAPLRSLYPAGNAEVVVALKPAVDQG